MDKFQRVNRGHPCPICERPDWCAVSNDGDWALCARVESDKPCGDKGAGWLHRINAPLYVPPPKPKFRPKPKPIDWAVYAKRCFHDLPDQDDLCHRLGVSEESMGLLRLGWDQKRLLYTFPMRDAAGHIIGIRTRTRRGDKRAIEGSRNGLFCPPQQSGRGVLWICEGPTDCAALLSMGLVAVGRPSNTGGHDLLVVYCQRRRELVIVADRDRPGSDAERLTLGAVQKLVSALHGKLVRVVRIPQAKDVRAYLIDGGNRAGLEMVAAQQVYQ